jgi:hypothetical protein
MMLIGSPARGAYDSCFDSGIGCPSGPQYAPTPPSTSTTSWHSRDDSSYTPRAPSLPDVPDGWPDGRAPVWAAPLVKGNKLFDKGYDLYAAGSFDRAHNYFEDARKSYADAIVRGQPRAQLGLAQAECSEGAALYKLSRWNEAWTLFERGLEHEPGLEDCRYNRQSLGEEYRHWQLVDEPWFRSPAVKQALSENDAKIQSICDGFGDYLFDEYVLVIDAMPPGVSPAQLLGELAKDFNGFIHRTKFDLVNRFIRRNSGPPAVGDIYDIKFVEAGGLAADAAIEATVEHYLGVGVPSLAVNGSVMLVEQTDAHFVLQTLRGKKYALHPEAGARAFGFWPGENGSVVFYTMAASRPTARSEADRRVGAAFQRIAWRELLQGLGAQVIARGGRVRHWAEGGARINAARCHH